jgi:CubicO group peptidase (beta-lactamase class C family)
LARKTLIGFTDGLCLDWEIDMFDWQEVEPEDVGMDSVRLGGMRDQLAERGTKALFVVRRDRVVLAWYAEDQAADRKQGTASLAKALVGGVSLMVAMAEGVMAADDLACEYVPEWRDDPVRSKITIRHLATHSSGVEDAELSQADIERAKADGRDVSSDHMALPAWKGGFWRKDPDPFTLSRDEAPIIFEPGTQYAYSNPGMAMLSYCVTAAIQSLPQKDVRALLKERVMDVMGVAEDEWAVGYGQTYDVNGLPLVANWGGGSFSARATARVGRLMLRRGDWEGAQLIPSEHVDQVVAYAGTPLPDRPDGNPQPGSGLGWWTNFDGVWPNIPKDAYGGAGAGNQHLLVIPSLDLIVVRNGGKLGQENWGEGFWGGAEKYIFNPLVDAITAQA